MVGLPEVLFAQSVSSLNAVHGIEPHYVFPDYLYKKLGVPGIALVVQTFGDYAKRHPHFFALVGEWALHRDRFLYVLEVAAIWPLVELFRASVLKMLKDEGSI